MIQPAVVAPTVDLSSVTEYPTRNVAVHPPFAELLIVIVVPVALQVLGPTVQLKSEIVGVTAVALPERVAVTVTV
jgi:hypothetical protein